MKRGQHHRLQNFIDSAFILAEKTETKIELLIVEWNPPNDKRRIIDAFVSAASFFLAGSITIYMLIPIFYYYRDSEAPNI